MEKGVGVVFDVVTLNPKTREQLFVIRNDYIKNGEITFTTNDVIERAVDALFKIEQMQKKVAENQLNKAVLEGRQKEANDIKK